MRERILLNFPPSNNLNYYAIYVVIPDLYQINTKY